MGIEVGFTLKDAVNRLASPRGALVLVGFLIFRLVDMVVYETLVGALIEWLINTFGARAAREMGYDVPDWAVSVDRVVAELRDDGYFVLAEQIEQLTSMGLDLPLWAVLPLLLLLPIVAELVYVVAVRAIAADGSDPVPVDAIVSGLPGAYFKSLFANFVAWLLIAIGFLAFGIPGLILALIFFFVRHHVVLGDDGIFEALGNSYGTVKANIGPVLALFFLLLVLGVGFTYGLGFLGLPGWLHRVLTTLVIVFSIAVTTSAYLQTDPDYGSDSAV